MRVTLKIAYIIIGLLQSFREVPAWYCTIGDRWWSWSTEFVACLYKTAEGETRSSHLIIQKKKKKKTYKNQDTLEILDFKKAEKNTESEPAEAPPEIASEVAVAAPEIASEEDVTVPETKRFEETPQVPLDARNRRTSLSKWKI